METTSDRPRSYSHRHPLPRTAVDARSSMERPPRRGASLVVVTWRILWLSSMTCWKWLNIERWMALRTQGYRYIIKWPVQIAGSLGALRRGAQGRDKKRCWVASSASASPRSDWQRRKWGIRKLHTKAENQVEGVLLRVFLPLPDEHDGNPTSLSLLTHIPIENFVSSFEFIPVVLLIISSLLARINFIRLDFSVLLRPPT